MTEEKTDRELRRERREQHLAELDRHKNRPPQDPTGPDHPHDYGFDLSVFEDEDDDDA
jgi:uncharacterized protein YciI